MTSGWLQLKKVLDMGSGRKRGSKILGVMTEAEAERLLLDWANLGENDLRRFRARHKDVIGALDDLAVCDLRYELRLVWNEQDKRRQDWYVFCLRDSFQYYEVMHDIKEKREPPNPHRLAHRLAEPPGITPFEAAMFYFQTALTEKAKYCGGRDCPAPYFIAVKRWQKYCSEKCAALANGEAKRRWWHENKGKASS
jgi:hypothetical protein